MSKKNNQSKQNQIRKKIKKQRSLLNPNNLKSASSQLLEIFKQKKCNSDWNTVALYADCDNEVPTQDALDFVFEEGITVLLPVMKEKSLMDFYVYHPDHLTPNEFGISEPNPQKCKLVSLSQSDAVFVPCVAFDQKGYRIGRGKGYYDRALAALKNEEIKPRFIGVAYSFQRVEDCFPEKHDIKMDEMLVVKL